MSKYNFYIASPFFNEEQLERLEYIKKCLNNRGFTFFSPKDELWVKPGDGKAIRQKAFQDNLEAIKTSAFILAVTDGKDMGTLFECGYAYSEGIPIVYFCETLGNRPFNLMLSQSSWAVLTSRTKLKEWLVHRKIIEYKGEIE